MSNKSAKKKEPLIKKAREEASRKTIEPMPEAFWAHFKMEYKQGDYRTISKKSGINVDTLSDAKATGTCTCKTLEVLIKFYGQPQAQIA